MHALTKLPDQMHPFNITCLLTQLRLHRLAVHVDALLGRGPVGHVAPRGPQRRLLQVRIRGQILQVDPRAPRHRVSNMEFMTQYFVSPSQAYFLSSGLEGCILKSCVAGPRNLHQETLQNLTKQFSWYKCDLLFPPPSLPPPVNQIFQTYVDLSPMCRI